MKKVLQFYKDKDGNIKKIPGIGKAPDLSNVYSKKETADLVKEKVDIVKSELESKIDEIVGSGDVTKAEFDELKENVDKIKGVDSIGIENVSFITKKLEIGAGKKELCNALNTKTGYMYNLGGKPNARYFIEVEYPSLDLVSIPIEQGKEYILGFKCRKYVWTTTTETNVAGSVIEEVSTESPSGTILTAPEGASCLIIAFYHNVGCSLYYEYEGILTSEAVLSPNIKIEKVEDIEEKVNQNKEVLVNIKRLETPYICIKQKNEDFLKRFPFEWKPFNGKHYAIMSIDDGRTNLPIAAELFKTLDVPLNLAIPAERLGAVLSNGKTLKNYALELQEDGCEIFSHGYRYTGNITTLMTLDEIIEEIIKAKNELYKAGFECKGFIKSGGANVPSTLNDYIGLINEYHIYGSACANVTYPQYYNIRKYLDDGIVSVKSAVDDLVSKSEGGYQWFYCHEVDGAEENVTSANVTEFVNYAKENGIEFVTFGWLYDKFGTHN